MPDEYVIVLTTLPADADAVDFARTLVNERLAACVNVPAEMTSVYWWDGELSQDVERQVIIKTTRARVGPLWDRIRDLHPYEVPEFVVLPIIDGSDAYLHWIGESTAEEGPT
ncbi:MAG: divalent-cation tolerance protein CutA [Vicinamibacterales bacterium]